MGGKISGGMTEEEARAYYDEKGRVPFGWIRTRMGTFIRDIEFTELLGVLEEGSNKVGEGINAFLTDKERGELRSTGRSGRQFVAEFRAPITEILDFRKFAEEMGVPLDEEMEAPEEDLLRVREFLARYRSPAKVVFPRGVATDALVHELLAGRRVPSVDLYKSPNVTDACLRDLKGVKKLWIDETNMGFDMREVGETLLELEAIDSLLDSRTFPSLRFLRKLSCGYKNRVGDALINTFAPLTSLTELTIESLLDSVTCFDTIPLGVEMLDVHNGQLVSADLARLPALRRLKLNHCLRVRAIPATVQEVSLRECAVDPLTFAGRRFEAIVFNRMPFVPQPAFARSMFFKMMELREADLPPCEALVIHRCGEIRLSRLPPMLLELEMRATEFLYEDGDLNSTLWARLRARCRNLRIVRFDVAVLRFAKGRSTGFDIEFL